MATDHLSTADMVDAGPPTQPSPKGRGLSGRVVLPASFEEPRLFSLLLWRFQGPNGPLSFMGPRGGDPDGPFKWDFLFTQCGVHIQVIRTVNGLEVWWWGGSASEAAILAYLNHNLEAHREDVDTAMGTLERYSLLLNPYARHRSMAELSREELCGLDPVAPDTPLASEASDEMLQKYCQQLQKFYQNVDREAMYAILLVAESAFMAEAYLNLLYAAMVRPVIRESRSLMKECLRRPWKSKIEHLAADCDYVAKQPEMGDKRVAEATWLFDLRNRIAHSYPDHAQMRIGRMWFFDRYPILPWAAPYVDMAHVLNNQLPSKEEALRAFDAGSGLVAFLRDLLDDDVAQQVNMLVAAKPLGYNETKSVYGVPFARVMLLLPKY